MLLTNLAAAVQRLTKDNLSRDRWSERRCPRDWGPFVGWTDAV